MNQEQAEEWVMLVGGECKATRDEVGMFVCLESECGAKRLTPFGMYLHRRVEHDPAY